MARDEMQDAKVLRGFRHSYCSSDRYHLCCDSLFLLLTVVFLR